MKFPAKIFICLSAAVLIAAIAVMWLLIIFDREITVKVPPRQTVLKVDWLPSVPAAERPEKFTSEIIRRSNARANDSDDPAERLHKAASDIVLSLLPEGTVTAHSNQPGSSLKLIASHTALITGIAVLPGSAEKSEKRIEYQVKVDFLPGGGCEAQFPQFRILPDRQ